MTVAHPTVFMFAGQGSQFYGMGRQLRAEHPVFDRTLRTLDTMFADAGLPGRLEELYRTDRGPRDSFDRFAHTHPAILMVELGLLDVLLAEGVGPDYVLGTSLGEYAAAAAAGVLDREDLTRAVAAQVRLTEELCPPGGMLAVLAEVSRFDPEQPPWRGLELAAVNYARHFVVSGTPDALDAAERALAAEGTACQRLPVRYAFHSSQVDVVAEPYRRMMAGIALRPPGVELVSCATGAVIGEVTPEHMWDTVRGPIRFREAIRTLEAQHDEVRYVDLGPSPTLAGFAAHSFRAGSGARARALLHPFVPPDTALKEIKEICSPAPASAPVPAPVSAGRAAGPVALLFPGQGSQRRGMAEGLFAEFPDLVAEADDTLGYSVEELCRYDPRGELDRTEFTQPALFVANALHYRAWQREHGDRAAFFAGHSLGEYSALWAAGAFDFVTGLRLVRRRGALMAAAPEGAMAAVIGMDEDQVRGVLAGGASAAVDVANLNGAGQVVVSGPREAVLGAKAAFLAAGAAGYVPLRVSGAFHSRQMSAAAADFADFLARTDLRAPRLPVIANTTGAPYPEGDIRPVLTAQLTSPVRWEESVRHLLSQVPELVEVGPGTVLTKLLDKIRAAVPAVPVPTTPVPAVPVPTTPVPAMAAPATPVPAVPVPPSVSSARQGVADGRTAVPAGASAPGAGALGSDRFRAAYGVRHAYVCGSMFRGISSEALVARAARAGLLAFYGAGGLAPEAVDAALGRLRGELGGLTFGVNLPQGPDEEARVDLLLAHGVSAVEASGFTEVTPALARYRLRGLARGADGGVVAHHRVLAKVTLPRAAEAFLRPVPEGLVRALRAGGAITAEQAELAALLPAVDDLCLEADSGGHTDRGALAVLLPAVLRLRARLGADGVRLGAAGGLGTPEAIAAAFLLGADFVLTGSVNLCTAESGISDVAKDMLENIAVGDTDYAPSAGAFETGGQTQVLGRGVFFPGRARKLLELHRAHASLEELDVRTRTILEQRWFRRPLEQVWRETRAYFAEHDPGEAERAERDPHHRMALVFRWYLAESQRLAIEGDKDRRVDFQIHCGPALAAFNDWVSGTDLEHWPDRHVENIADRLMTAAADHLAGVSQ
ncbi:ACP S-malonyltransferase [Streptomyces sp. ML-6]|uniref:ACP S-malonyltransferase n=1 Tax=Streptomyces sp. ML-6 TaxID=2982693 RepID=UPI0024C03F46|nr:ACP S-malonyltransferase [Streptomyces sp. ML-6]MDK0524163.1 ACP S-malonyltransferase [Streptomyces sp. ML-6]